MTDSLGSPDSHPYSVGSRKKKQNRDRFCRIGGSTCSIKLSGPRALITHHILDMGFMSDTVSLATRPGCDDDDGGI